MFVVEGRSDESRLKQIYPKAKVIITNGSAINQDSMGVLKELENSHDIILFLDPDHAGERIRRILEKSLKKVYHAFLDREVSYSKNKKKIGVEHASKKDIIEALKNIYNQDSKITSNITYLFLYKMKLMGHVGSKNNRKTLSRNLKIGQVNGKTLFDRLQMFGINQKEVIEVLSETSS
jgi:ribonuclease M5